MVNVYIISDSSGETAIHMTEAILIHFPDMKFVKKRYSDIITIEQVDEILANNQSEKTVIFMTMVIDEVARYIKSKEGKNFKVIDLLLKPIEELEKFIGVKSLHETGLMRDLDNNYFDKIAAIEFAVNFDDGKNPKGFLDADIVLLGVSRTSKTPLSLFLANKGYKVGNLPLVPEVDIPREIYQIDRKKMIGLIIDPEKLNEIRNQRLIALGLSSDSSYATDDRIHDELEYAKELYKNLEIKVIDVSTSTIEETAAKILEHIEN